jgi:hypothetical protein
MHRSTLRLVNTIGPLLLLWGAMPTTLVAQTRSPMIVHAPLRVPGALLVPGRYEISFAADGKNVVLISDVGHRFVALVPTIPIVRAHAGAVIELRSPIPGSGAELASWYPTGGTSGYAFAPHAQAHDVSSATLAGLDRDVTAADNAVRHAQGELRAAQFRQKAVRQERRNAR